jgi:hypothetical protein
LILALSKSNPFARWKAVSNSFEAGDCGGGWRQCHIYRKRLGMDAHVLRPRVSSLWHGALGRTIKQVQLISGSKEVRRTWGVGFKALMAEISGKGVQ